MSVCLVLLIKLKLCFTVKIVLVYNIICFWLLFGESCDFYAALKLPASNFLAFSAEVLHCRSK